MKRNCLPENHLYFIDALRTVAAICILVWHYYHFDWTYGQEIYKVSRDESPFLDELNLFYSRGLWAVQLFWIVSGLIFSYVYSKRETDGKMFFINRFSRLYPLHFVTLLFIAISQYLSWNLVGHFQIVENNTVQNFVGNLIFNGGGFNSVIWSVNAEIMVYALFFICLPFIARRGALLTVALVIVSMFLNALQINSFFNTWCATYFFWGVLIHKYFAVYGRNFAANIAISGVMFFCGEWLFRNRFDYDFPNIMEILYLTPFVILFLSADVLFKDKMRFERIFSWFGNLTYSLYLWHLPIQVLVLTIFTYFGISRTIFKEEFIFILWLLFMILVATLSFKYIELPLKQLSKGKLKRVLYN